MFMGVTRTPNPLLNIIVRHVTVVWHVTVVRHAIVVWHMIVVWHVMGVGKHVGEMGHSLGHAEGVEGRTLVAFSI